MHRYVLTFLILMLLFASWSAFVDKIIMISADEPPGAAAVLIGEALGSGNITNAYKMHPFLLSLLRLMF